MKEEDTRDIRFSDLEQIKYSYVNEGEELMKNELDVKSNEDAHHNEEMGNRSMELDHHEVKPSGDLHFTVVGDNILTALQCIQKCENVMMLINEINDKTLVLFTCKLNETKQALDNLLKEFSQLSSSENYLSLKMKEDQEFKLEDYEVKAEVFDDDFLQDDINDISIDNSDETKDLDYKPKFKTSKKEKKSRDNQEHICNECNEFFPSRGKLQYHKKMGCHHHSTVSCHFCNQIFKTKKILSVHLTKMHNVGFKCDVCNEEFNEKIYLKEHKKEKHNKNSCNMCNMTFECHKALYAHMKEENHRNYFCDVCSKSFFSSSNLRNHIKDIHLKLNCDLCDEVLDGRLALKTHSLRVHGTCDGKEYVCPICGYTSKRSNSFSGHMKTHGPRDNKCEQCGKGFKTKAALNKHIRRHEGVKPFACTVCDARFENKGKLDRHNVIHTGERNYECNLCGKKFNQPGNLKTHMKSHSNGTIKVPFVLEIKEDL